MSRETWNSKYYFVSQQIRRACRQRGPRAFDWFSSKGKYWHLAFNFFRLYLLLCYNVSVAAVTSQLIWEWYQDQVGRQKTGIINILSHHWMRLNLTQRAFKICRGLTKQWLPQCGCCSRYSFSLKKTWKNCTLWQWHDQSSAVHRAKRKHLVVTQLVLLVVKQSGWIMRSCTDRRFIQSRSNFFLMGLSFF